MVHFSAIFANSKCTGSVIHHACFANKALKQGSEIKYCISNKVTFSFEILCSQ